MAKTEPNWTAIEVPYRAGIMSVRQIANSFDVPLTTLLRHAKKRGWERADLAPRIKQATQDRLTQDEPQQRGEPLSKPPENGSMQGLGEGESRVNSCDADRFCARARESGMDPDFVIAAASRLQADVTKAHRRDMARATALCKQLMAELAAETEAIEVIEAEIKEATIGDKTDTRRRMMMRAVSHSTRAQSMRTLTSALADLVKMERESFGMDTEKDSGEEKVPTLEERLKEYARRAGIDGSAGRVVELIGRRDVDFTDKPL